MSEPPEKGPLTPNSSQQRSAFVDTLTSLFFHVPRCVLGDISVLENDQGQAMDHHTCYSQADDQVRIRRARLLPVPHFSRRESALLFVDISGFTHISTLLEVETLSKTINSYFDMMVDLVHDRGGDVLKFAGDAFFAEWQVQPPTQGRTDYNCFASLAECAHAAAKCGADIVKDCSDYVVTMDPDATNAEDQFALLNVHCGLGVGHLVGLHVGDFGEDERGAAVVDHRSDSTRARKNNPNEWRREFLFLGDPINQVRLYTSLPRRTSVQNACLSNA